MANYKDLFDRNSIGLNIDISTLCNAGCPQCHRTNPDGLGSMDFLPLMSVDLETFKKYYSPKNLKHVNNINLCGTWGDPIMNRDFLKIIQYLVDHSSCRINIATNGSMRQEDFWWELAAIGKKRLSIVFAIDGSTQEIHELYRYSTDLDKILNNMKMVSAGGGFVGIFTVVFKHNEDDLENIWELGKKYGAMSMRYIPSNRFGGRESTMYRRGNGHFTLEPSKKVTEEGRFDLHKMSMA